MPCRFRLKQSLFASAACLTLWLTTIPAIAAAPPALASYLDGVEGFSGTVLVGRPDGSVSRYARGLADDSEERAFSDDDVWRWASVTKQIVAVLVLQEVAAGRLTLETPLSEALPDFETKHAAGITLRHLLKHRSGLPDPDDLSPEEFAAGFDPAAFCTGRAVTRPGGDFEYNNCDFHVLGQVVERASGMPWSEALRERILEPAAMTRTAVAPGPLEESVTGYVSAGEPAPPVPLAFYGAAGAIYGHPADLLRFNRALMSGRLLAPEWLEVLWASEPSEGYAALGAWTFPAQLAGCVDPPRIVERRGFIGSIAVRNFLAPELGTSVAVFVNRGDFDFGEVWMGTGFSYDLLRLTLCGGKS